MHDTGLSSVCGDQRDQPQFPALSAHTSYDDKKQEKKSPSYFTMVVQRLRQLVEKAFYRHGHFCASHPLPLIAFVGVVVIVCSYPVINLPMPGTAPIEYTTSSHNYKEPPRRHAVQEGDTWEGGTVKPRWYSGPPVGYIQQFVINATVYPWERRGMVPEDAFRLPLYKALDISDDIETFVSSNGKGINTWCLYVQQATDPKQQDILPKHKCLVLSPANMWGRDKTVFKNDAKLVETVFKHKGNAMTGGTSVKDLLFGIPSRYTGIHRFYLRSRKRHILYAVTMVLQTYNESFVQELRQHLKDKYNADVPDDEGTKSSDHIVHIHYRERRNLLEMSPLIFIYVLLMLYIYFSVKKIEMVKSKLGLAFAAVVMVMVSLSTSVGICIFFGLTPTLSGSEIFPYLVVIIGLENILVFTKSVVSTPVHMEVKSRIAQGLSKEGWSITKNLCTELLIVVFGFFTFVPAIQEFCLFALVGLLTDFFLQMIYFVSVLAIDIRRMELSDLHRAAIQQELASEQQHKEQEQQMQQNHHQSNNPTNYPLGRMPRSKSAPRSLHQLGAGGGGGWDAAMVGDKMRATPSVTMHRTPRRLRIIYFWASTRMMQRLIMAASVLWILFTLMFMYKAGLVDHLRDNRSNHTLPVDAKDIQSLHRDPNSATEYRHTQGEANKRDSGAETGGGNTKSDGGGMENGENAQGWQHHMEGLLWRKLPQWHWPTLFNCYNISLSGRYISVLPPMDLTMVINPKESIAMRHQLEVEKAKKWYHQDADYRFDLFPQDPEMADMLEMEGLILNVPLYQASVWDYYVTMLLGILSGASLVILIMLVFKCVALTRIRSARFKKGKHADIISKATSASEYVRWELAGHAQEIECLFSEGSWVVSCCLAGEIRMWNPGSAECIMTIDRESYFQRRRPCSAGGMRSPVRGGVRKRHSSGPEFPSWPGGNNGGGTPQSGSLSDNGSPGILVDQLTLKGAINTDFSGGGNSDWEHNGGGDNNRTTSSNSDPMFAENTSSPNLNSTSPNLNSTSPNLNSTDGYNFKSVIENCTKSNLDIDGYSDSGYPSPPPTNRNSLQNLSTIDEDEGSAFRRRAWSGTATVGRANSPQWPKFEVGYNSPQSPDSAFYNYGRFSFDEDVLRNMNGGEVNGEGMRSQNGSDSCLDGGQLPTVWCLCCNDQLVVVGCSNGRIEIWDTSSGFLLGSYDDINIGATEMCMIVNRLCIARLDGTINFLDLVSHHSVHVSYPGLNRAAAGVPRCSSASEFLPMGGAIICSLFKSVLAHQQPINDMQVSRDHVITASQDHTLKVFRLEDALCLFTLRAHEGSVTSLFVDKATSYSIVSGSTDGRVCLWNTLTGACVHRLRGHISTVLSVTCSQDHVISVGMDNRLCMWKRRRGRLLHVIQMDPGSCSSVVTLSSKLIVTGGQGYVVVWDIVQGEPLRVIKLGSGDHLVRQIIAVENSSAVVCDYGKELRVVQLPTQFEDKTD